MKKSLVAILFILGWHTNASYGQAQKFATVNTDSVLAALPTYKAVEKELENYRKQALAQAQTMQQRLREKYEELIQMSPSSTPAIEIKAAQQEFQKAQENYQKFEQTFQQNFAKKNRELLQPMRDRISDAIATLAKEKGYDFVFPTGAFLYPSKDAADATNTLITRLSN